MGKSIVHPKFENLINQSELTTSATGWHAEVLEDLEARLNRTLCFHVYFPRMHSARNF